MPNTGSQIRRAESAKHESPGQRPGLAEKFEFALKGQNKRRRFFVTPFQGLAGYGVVSQGVALGFLVSGFQPGKPQQKKISLPQTPKIYFGFPTMVIS